MRPRTQRPEPHRRCTPSLPTTPCDSVPLTDSVPGAQCFQSSPCHGDPEGAAFPPHITASPRIINRGNHPAQIKSLAHSRHLRMSLIIGNAANRTFGANAFTRIPAEEARWDCPYYAYGFQGEASPLLEPVGFCAAQRPSSGHHVEDC